MGSLAAPAVSKHNPAARPKRRLFVTYLTRLLAAPNKSRRHVRSNLANNFKNVPNLPAAHVQLMPLKIDKLGFNVLPSSVAHVDLGRRPPDNLDQTRRLPLALQKRGEKLCPVGEICGVEPPENPPEKVERRLNLVVGGGNP